MTEEEAKRKLKKAEFIGGVICSSILSIFFFVFAILLRLTDMPARKLEYYVENEIYREFEAFDEYEEYGYPIIQIEEIKTQQNLIEENVDWKIYKAQTLWMIDDSGGGIIKQEYICFVCYKFVRGKLGEKGYYAILDCDIAKIITEEQP